MATIRDNDLYITVPSEYKIINGSYKIKDEKITSGQEGSTRKNTTLTCGSDGKFVFNVGRKGKDYVASWFNSQVDTSKNTTFGHPAGNLNFAFIGDLSLKIQTNLKQETYSFKDIVIAQGKNGSSNNWWFGGRQCMNIGNNQVSMLSDVSSLSFCFKRGGNSVNHIDILKLYNSNQWMKSIDSDITLDKLNIPGTHDSGTYTAGALDGAGMVKTQSLSIYEQLNEGIRYLDIRCRHIDNKFTIHHGMVYLNLNFDGVLEQCKRFLQENPQECIVMQVVEEHTEESCTQSYETTFYSYVNLNTELWYLEDKIPTLIDARGKIVLVRRFKLDKDTKNKGGINYKSDLFDIQDDYKLGYNDSISKKWTAISQALTKAKQKQKWYINYTSAAGTPAAQLILGYTPAGVATGKNLGDLGMNSRLADHMVSNSNDFVGTILMDFPEYPSLSSTVRKILNKNF